MKRLMCSLLMGFLVAQDLPTGENQRPIMKKPFHLSYDDISEINTNSAMKTYCSLKKIVFILNDRNYIGFFSHFFS